MTSCHLTDKRGSESNYFLNLGEYTSLGMNLGLEHLTQLIQIVVIYVIFHINVKIHQDNMRLCNKNNFSNFFKVPEINWLICNISPEMFHHRKDREVIKAFI